ncbi:hypothetical protein [Ochrobactrum quorumnocens]|uniref:hypothetical protein n=1 Tax=Ochrobactrum quorumnocens TaxID=271865 RepID=UPI003BA382DA
MKIAYLGWGSLIWNPDGLPIRGVWHDDGPVVPLEFARESSGQRLTLVIVDEANPVRALWCLADVNTVDEGTRRLAEREGIGSANIKHSIGFWRADSGASHGRSASEISAWGAEKRLDAVLWTNLKFGLEANRDVMPTYDAALAHLKSLPPERSKVAEVYIRRAPKQVDTDFRRGFERDLGWSFKQGADET